MPGSEAGSSCSSVSFTSFCRAEDDPSQWLYSRIDVEGRGPLTRYGGRVVDVNRTHWDHFCHHTPTPHTSPWSSHAHAYPDPLPQQPPPATSPSSNPPQHVANKTNSSISTLPQHQCPHAKSPSRTPGAPTPQNVANFATCPPSPASPWQGRSIVCLPLLPPLSKPVLLWSGLMAVVDVSYTTFLLPFFIAFTQGRQLVRSCYMVEMVVGPLFFLDLLLGFHVSFVARHRISKGEVSNGKLVAEYYIKHGNFLPDLLATIPWVVELARYSLLLHSLDRPAAHWWGMDLIRALRFARLTRLVAFFKSLYMGSFLAGYSGQQPLSTRTAYTLLLSFTAAALANFLGCFLYLVARWEGLHHSWVMQVNDSNLSNAPVAVLWLTSVYWALTTIATVGYGEIVPTTTAERGAAMLVMLAGAVFFGFVISTLAEVLTALGREEKRSSLYRKKIAAVDHWVGQLPEIPEELRSHIYHYFSNVWVRQQEEEELWESVVRDLPRSLRANLALHLTQPALQQLPPFHSLKSSELRVLAAYLKPMSHGREREICEEGEEADCLWVLTEGTVVLRRCGAASKVVHAPAVLGAACVLLATGGEDRQCTSGYQQWSYTIFTYNTCTMWKLDKRGMKLVLQRLPHLRKEVEEALRKGLVVDVVSEADELVNWISEDQMAAGSAE